MSNILKDLRKAKNETQEQTAKNLELTQSNYQKYESADISSISNATLLRFADYFGVTIEYLLGREKAEAKPSGNGAKTPAYTRISAGTIIKALCALVLAFVFVFSLVTCQTTNKRLNQLRQELEEAKMKEGPKGNEGKSAYDLVLEKGYTGTLTEWLDSLFF